MTKLRKWSIGAPIWPGISKLVEEMGEVSQVCGKLMGTEGDEIHFDGSNLREKIQEEIADLMAAIAFVVELNDLDYNFLETRADEKFYRFKEWHEGSQ